MISSCQGTNDMAEEQQQVIKNGLFKRNIFLVFHIRVLLLKSPSRSNENGVVIQYVECSVGGSGPLRAHIECTKVITSSTIAAFTFKFYQHLAAGVVIRENNKNSLETKVATTYSYGKNTAHVWYNGTTPSLSRLF